jgi:hypothetical protein
MNTLLRKISPLVIGLAAVLMPAIAQENQNPAPGKGYERVEQYKKIRLMEVLDLDEQTSIKFFARYNKNQELLRDLRKQQVQALGRVQALRKSKASDDEYDKIISDLLSFEKQVNEAKAKYVDELKQVLTSKQLAEYLVFETRFQQNLRDLLRDMPRNRQEAPRR